MHARPMPLAAPVTTPTLMSSPRRDARRVQPNEWRIGVLHGFCPTEYCADLEASEMRPEAPVASVQRRPHPERSRVEVGHRIAGVHERVARGASLVVEV